VTETTRRSYAMDDQAGTCDGFIYINWRGKSFLIDERYADGLRNYRVEQVGTDDDGFIYINWRGKSFLVDEWYAEGLRKYLMEEAGCTPEEVSDITPEKLIRDVPANRINSNTIQLEEM
jgi:hypothetical protein